MQRPSSAAQKDRLSSSVIAPSLADIFRGNAVKNGIVPVTLEATAVRALMGAVEHDPAVELSVDVETATVSVPAIAMRRRFSLRGSS